MTQTRLLDVFSALVEASPESVALLDGHAGTRAPSPVTRAELATHAGRIAVVLADLDVTPGDGVAVWMPNWSSAVATQLAALTLGAHVVGINTRYNTDEVAHVLDSARPKVVVIADGFAQVDLVDRLTRAAAATTAPLPAVLVLSAPGLPPAEHPERFDVGNGAHAVPADGPTLPLKAHPVAGLATAFTTSGSTGRAKLAAHSEHGVVTQALAVAEATGMNADSVIMGVLPLSGVFGFTPVMAALLTGATALLEPVFDDSGVLADLSAARVTHAAGADDVFSRLQAAWHVDQPPMALQWIGIADFEGKSRAFAQWAEQQWGTTVVGVYGSSETFALAAFWHATDPTPARWGGGGRPVSPEIEWRLADPVTGQPVADGVDGEIQFRGYNVVDAYLGDERLIHSASTDDGWFTSGDLGRRHDDGSFTYICRMGDVLRLRGFLVDPAEIELRLLQHPKVNIAKVVGATGTEGGTVAVAFVVPTDDAAGESQVDEAELLAWCAESLAKFKVPQRVVIRDALPTTAGTNGTKIRAAALRTIAAEILAGDVPHRSVDA
ncbi:AMP-binding protein [Kribbia dieselivorans]|uniref:AMP-binding protein n=1 Tax=Kribbia dieselivorans TaxID=331526 RepID=UPI000839225C|nr:AMP-binding protein [Kribbia dieselivorans]